MVITYAKSRFSHDASYLSCINGYILHSIWRFLVSFRRQRATQPGSSPYTVLLDAVHIKPTSIEVPLLNTQNNVRLLLQLFGIKDNMARLKINELEPIKQRYEIPVGDALVGEPKQQE